MPDEARRERWIYLALAAYGLLIAVWLSRHSVQITQEDGYYYYKIAQQMVVGNGSTFDGLHPTNGYHPLWLLCLLPLFRIATAPESALVLGVLLQGTLMATCGILVYSIARLALRPPAAALSALLWFSLTYREALSGLEFGLHALCILAAVHFYLNRFHEATAPTTAEYGILGLLLGLAFLARLDTLLLGILLGAFLLARERQRGWNRESLPHLIAYSLPILALCLLYVGINLAAFGHPIPVSSVLKREWSATLLEQDPLYRTYGWLVAKGAHLFWPLQDLKAHVPMVVGVYIAPLLFMFSRRLLSPFLIYSIAQFLVTALLYHSDLSEKPWYYVIQPWLTVLLAGFLFQRLADLRTAPQRAATGLSSFLSVALLLAWCAIPLKMLWTLRQWEGRAGQEHTELIEASRWIRANLPPDATVGTWNAGTIGFLSERRVVDLDGLVNSWDYAQVEHHDLCGYFQKTNITYLVDAFEKGKVLTRAQGFADYPSCGDQWQRIWSDNRPNASWHMEAYRRLGSDRMEAHEKR